LQVLAVFTGKIKYSEPCYTSGSIYTLVYIITYFVKMSGGIHKDNFQVITFPIVPDSYIGHIVKLYTSRRELTKSRPDDILGPVGAI
jgi:hypothetical protein